MKRTANTLSDTVLREGRMVTLSGRICATIPAPNENAIYVTVKVAGDSEVEVADS